MTNRQNQSLNHLLSYHLAKVDHYKSLKMASANNPALFHQYAEQQYLNQALAHKYEASIAEAMTPKGDKLETNPILTLLRNGGYNLYARHGEATIGEDQANINFQDCSTQRNLSEEGKRQAMAYGEALRSLYIPIHYPVLASPFCRTRETAELAFGKENVQVDPFWLETYYLSSKSSATEQQRILNNLKSALEIPPPAGSNKVIIAHSFPTGLGFGPIPYMGTVIVKPRGVGLGFEIIGYVPLNELLV